MNKAIGMGLQYLKGWESVDIHTQRYPIGTRKRVFTLDFREQETGGGKALTGISETSFPWYTLGLVSMGEVHTPAYLHGRSLPEFREYTESIGVPPSVFDGKVMPILSKKKVQFPL